MTFVRTSGYSRLLMMITYANHNKGTKKMIDFMIDLETLGNGPTSAIVQIGCVAFDRYTGELHDEYLVNVHLEEEMKLGFKVDASTIEWWMLQSALGKNTWVGESSLRPKDALLGLNKFVKDRGMKKSAMWSHATFDAPILFHHYKVMEIATPIKYSFWLDLRTLGMLGRGVASIPYEARPDDAHDALADCKYQVKWAVKCWNALAS